MSREIQGSFWEEKSAEFFKQDEKHLINRRRTTTIKEEEEDTRRPSIVYEEDMPVIVRRRGVTMTVRIFGAEEDSDETFKRKENDGRSHSVEVFKSPSQLPAVAISQYKKRACKSIGSLEDIRSEHRGVVKPQSRRQSFKQQYLIKMSRAYKAIAHSYSSSQSEDQSFEMSEHLKSPIGSPNSSLSPSSPDRLGMFRSESPTKGMGQFHKGRSSSIATSGFPNQTHLYPSRARSRRYSIDSLVPRRGKLRLLISKQYKKVY